MNGALPVKTYLSINDGKYFRHGVSLPRIESNVYVTIHPDTAATDLLHYHDKPHLSLVIKGGLIDRRRAGSVERFAGDLMYFRSGEPHESIYRGFPVKSINLELGAAFFSEAETNEESLGRELKRTPSAKFAMLKILNEFWADDEFTLESIETLLVELSSSSHVRSGTAPEWVKSLNEVLRDSWNKELSLRTLSNSIGVHPKTISKNFTRYFGCTFGEFRRRIRIENSLRVVASGRPLAEAAVECGFYDQSHFTSAFRRMTGMSPRQFQK